MLPKAKFERGIARNIIVTQMESKKGNNYGLQLSKRLSQIDAGTV